MPTILLIDDDEHVVEALNSQTNKGAWRIRSWITWESNLSDVPRAGSRGRSCFLLDIKA